MGEGNVFSVFTSGGGVPVSHNALQHFPECHGAARGVPCQVQLGGGVPCQVQPGGGTLAGGVPGGGTQLGQHREYLLHGGRYASCVHAGGLSCLNLLTSKNRTIVFNLKIVCSRENDTGRRLKRKLSRLL